MAAASGPGVNLSHLAVRPRQLPVMRRDTIPHALEADRPAKPDKPQGVDDAFFDKLEEHLGQPIVSQIRPAATTSGTP